MYEFRSSVPLYLAPLLPSRMPFVLVAVEGGKSRLMKSFLVPGRNDHVAKLFILFLAVCRAYPDYSHHGEDSPATKLRELDPRVVPLGLQIARSIVLLVTTSAFKLFMGCFNSVEVYHTRFLLHLMASRAWSASLYVDKIPFHSFARTLGTNSSSIQSDIDQLACHWSRSATTNHP